MAARKPAAQPLVERVAALEAAVAMLARENAESLDQLLKVADAQALLIRLLRELEARTRQEART